MNQKSHPPGLFTYLCIAFTLTLGGASAADVLWTNISGGNWNVPANWNTGTVPAAGDRALITLPGTYTVTLNVNATLTGLELGSSGSGKQTLLVNSSARTLTLNGPSSVAKGGALKLTAGTVTGTGELTVADEMEWSGGTLTGSGGTMIPTGGILKLTSTASKSLNGRTIQNSGTVQLDSTGTLAMSGGALIENQATGLFEVLADADVTSSGTPQSVLHNLGTIRRTSGNDIVGVTAKLNNEGRVEVLSGTLQVGGTGLTSGIFDIAANTILRFSATYDCSASAVIQGAGRGEFSGGTVSINGSYNVTGGTAASGNASVNFGGPVLAVGNTLNVGGSTATANFTTNTLSLKDVTLTGGTLQNAASMVIDGAFSWSGGTLGGSGQVSISPTGSLNLSGTVARQLVSRVLNLQGTATWIDNSTLTMSGAAEFNIQPGATFELRGDSTLATSGTPRSVLNVSGTLLRSTSPGIFRIGCDGNNSGAVRVTSGTLVLQGGGTGSGEFNGDAGTKLQFAAGYTLTEASRIASAGTVDFYAGTLTVPGTYDVTGATLVSATTASVRFSGPSPKFGSSLTVSAGTADLGDLPASIPKVTLSNGTISGAGVLTITENLTWTGGAFSGTGKTLVASGATLALSGTLGKTLSARTLSIAGTATWAGAGGVALNTQAVFRVEPGATLELQGDATLGTSGSPASTFINEGTVLRNTGAGTFVINAPWTQSGSVQVKSGTLVVQNGGTGSGEFTGDAGTKLRFASAYDLTQTSRIASAGTVDFGSGTLIVAGAYEVTGSTAASGATVSFSGPAPKFGKTLTVSAGTANLGALPVSIPNVALSAGIISGTGILTITENLAWSGGTFSGTGTTLVAPGAIMAITAATGKTLSARILSIAGTATWAGNSTVALNTQAEFRIEAGGRLELQGDSTISWSGPSPASTFVNAGTVIRDIGAGTFTIGVPCTQTGLLEVRSGTLRFTSTCQQTAGTMRLAGGALSTSSFLDVQGGTLTGSGSINGVVRNSASSVIDPSGEMRIIATGGWTNAPGGVIEVELRGATPATEYDQLATTGRATLGGTLRVKLGGGFQPVIGDSFEVLRFASRTNNFSSFDGVLVPPNLYLSPTLTSTNLVLLTMAVPQPVLGTPQMTAGGSFRFQISEAAGLDVLVEATQDFSLWEPISTNLNCPALLQIIDTSATNYPHRFYRVKLN